MGYYDSDRRELATPETIADQVAQYQDAVARYKKLREMLAEISADCLPVYRYAGHREHLDFDLELTLAEALKDAWRKLVRRTQVEEVCSATRWKGIEDQIESGDIPDFTEENVAALLRSFTQELPDMFREACKEVLEWLRPGTWSADYKTNRKNATFEIGPKIIKEWVVDASSIKWGLVGIRYDAEKYLRSLHSVFKLLDGAGPARHPEDLPTQIKTAIREKRWECENEYLRCRWFKKGTMHIWIKREDLLAQFNARVHGKVLREAEKGGARHANVDAAGG